MCDIDTSYLNTSIDTMVSDERPPSEIISNHDSNNEAKWANAEVLQEEVKNMINSFT